MRYYNALANLLSPINAIREWAKSTSKSNSGVTGFLIPYATDCNIDKGKFERGAFRGYFIPESWVGMQDKLHIKRQIVHNVNVPIMREDLVGSILTW